MSNSPAWSGQPLSDREREAVWFVGELGPDYSEIASRMGISVNTLKTHLARARAKLGLRSRPSTFELTEAAVRAGLMGTPTTWASWIGTAS